MKTFSKHSKQFQNDGFVLVKNLLSKKNCTRAANWLKSQDPKKFLTSWTDKEPNVPLATYFGVHEDNSIISKIAKHKSVLNFASKLMNNKVYLWTSKVGLKAAWGGTVEYFHQDFTYWKDRGYRKDDMISVMIMLEPHSIYNAALHVFPKTHKAGAIKHDTFFNVNGLSKFMIHPKKLDKLKKKYGVKAINAEPGDVLFFHASLIHGSSHNISGNGRMVILSWFNTIGNLPRNVGKKARLFNLSRAKKELDEAQRKLNWFKKKYQDQLKSQKLTFLAPIPKEEKK